MHTIAVGIGLLCSAQLLLLPSTCTRHQNSLAVCQMDTWPSCDLSLSCSGGTNWMLVTSSRAQLPFLPQSLSVEMLVCKMGECAGCQCQAALSAIECRWRIRNDCLHSTPACLCHAINLLFSSRWRALFTRRLLSCVLP